MASVPSRSLRLIGIAAMAVAALSLPAAEHDEPFEFLVMGCMPYHMPADAARFENVISTANELGPTFSVHVGDTKYGMAPCDDEAYPVILDRFERFTHPLIYVPGDNEWTDCHTPMGGGFDPVDRLDLVRRMFFPEGRSLGKPPRPLTSQASLQPEFDLFVENNRWSHHRILFSTLHVVAWLKASFAEASKQNSTALVLFIHGNPFAENTRKTEPRGTGFANFVPALLAEVQDFSKPVYLFHADSHYFRIDKPLISSTGRTIENFTRIETFGGHNLHLIRVIADPDATEPIIAFPHLIEANRVDPSTPLPGRK